MPIMYRNILITLFSIGFYLLGTMAQATSPVWTFTPLTPTSISVSNNSTATIQYRVTNQSKKSHQLMMTPIQGITQTTTGVGICGNPFTLLSQGSSCTLSLEIYGNQLSHSIIDGPIICEQGSTLQCYRPGPTDLLNISLTTGSTYTLGGTVSGLIGTLVLHNGTDNKTLTNDGSFTFATALAEGTPYTVTVLNQPVGQICTVTNGSGTIGNADVTDVTVTCVVSQNTTLTTSVSTLALSVNNTVADPTTDLTGRRRVITITNAATAPAVAVTYTPSPPLPNGTTISPASCGTIAPSGSCVLMIEPGDTPSAASGSLNPTPITLTISGTNTNTLTPTINILTYGSVYQGGYVYAVFDDLPNTVSIGGTVVSLVDQAAPNSAIWSSNGTDGMLANVSLDSIPGINENSSTNFPSPDYTTSQASFNTTYSNTNSYPFPSSNSFSSCNGGTDGACNSRNILALYNARYDDTDYITTNYSINCDPNQGGAGCTLSAGKTATNLFAAGLCTGTINGYTDWYLPSICEIGPSGLAASGCAIGTQNIVNQLPDLIGNPSSGSPGTSCTYQTNCLAGSYWSSTEDSFASTSTAWSQLFDSFIGSTQDKSNKSTPLGVRCSRTLTR
jgi:hypothetical protein